MDDKKIEELLEQADNRYSIADSYDEWRKTDEEQATQKLEKLAKSYGKDELFEEYFIERVKQLNCLTDKQLLQEAESFANICKSEMADGKSLCYSKHYAEVTLWRGFVDEYCRLIAEVYDYADKHGVKDDPVLFSFASDCAEAYANERITDILHLKETFKADWQQDFLSKLQDRMMREQETGADSNTFGTSSARWKTHTQETMDMMFPEGNDDGISLPEN